MKSGARAPLHCQSYFEPVELLAIELDACETAAESLLEHGVGQSQPLVPYYTTIPECRIVQSRPL